MDRVVDEECVARKLWIKFRNDSVVAIYTLFIVCLAYGRSDSDAFLHCISQDVHPLKAFSQTYQVMDDCADDDEDKDAIRKMRKLVIEDVLITVAVQMRKTIKKKNLMHSSSDNQQLGGEDCPLIPPKSLPEMAVNGA
ncbi:hypothetical protein AAG906_000457 [Vitis piasezkii]